MALAYVAVTYLLRRPRLLGKCASGRLHPASTLVLAPFHVMNWLSLALFRAVGGVPYCEVAPDLLLGRRLTTREATNLCVDNVLDLTAEFSECSALRGRRYHTVAMLDGTAPSDVQLREAVEWLRDAMSRGRTYVHCALGHGRSATVVAGYLLATGQAANVADAIVQVQARRPGVKPTTGQRLALARLETQLRCGATHGAVT
jgi:protein-tyrosine phosphatase